jgi:hypothetical protein
VKTKTPAKSLPHPFDRILRAARAKGTDPAVGRWVTSLLTRGEQSDSEAARPVKRRRRRPAA